MSSQQIRLATVRAAALTEPAIAAMEAIPKNLVSERVLCNLLGAVQTLLNASNFSHCDDAQGASESISDAHVLLERLAREAE